MELCNLHAVFEKRLLRIPDYQRGYTWEKDHQIKDFWEDIIQLNIQFDANKIHYTGVVTLEPVKDICSKWEQDKWMIDMGYDPFYIVDGQQRLATSMILMQAIIEKVGSQNKLNEQSIDDVRNKYIYIENDERKSFLFGYEKGNPSDKFLRSCIFGVPSSGDSHQKPPKTLYTQNLREAKEYFKDKLSKMEVGEIESIFKKLTENIRFNLYEIDNKIDTFVAFETANNRGKKLTNLELLKSRLIYLSTLLEDGSGKELRPKINDAWKTIYEYLGKNPDQPLDDDEFLRNHWIMHFGYSNEGAYRDFLLDKKFIAQNISHPKEEVRLTAKKIDDYVESLEKSAEPWFYIHNPYYEDEDFSKLPNEEKEKFLDHLNELGFDEKNKKWLDRLNRLGFRSFKPLLLASYLSKKDTGDIKDINQLLKAVERCNFIMFELSQRRGNTGESTFYGYANKIKEDKKKILEVGTEINESWADYYYKPNMFFMHIEKKYTIYEDGWCDGGFATWGGLKYFLYEYEESLRPKGNESTKKISWEELLKYQENFVTVEHILPQTLPNSEDNPYWEERFGKCKFDKDQRTYLTHSLGNLLPLSRSKNSSLQNEDFHEKKKGYCDGSYSEREVAKNEDGATNGDWTAEKILKRGLKMLEFMEERCGKDGENIPLGDDDFKRKLLHLDFLPKDQQS